MMWRSGGVVCLAVGLALCCACSTPRAARPEAGVQEVDGRPRPPGALLGARDRTALEALARRRAADGPDDGYHIGPDDLLDVRIPDLLDAQPYAPAGRLASAAGTTSSVAAAPVYQQGMRVDAAGEIGVPTLGRVRAAGLTTAELEAEIARRLVKAGILRTPEVSVQVAEYRSAVVAVVGAVERPGLYPLTRPDATLADMIWAAGGPSRDAGRVVAFAPARPGATPPLWKLRGGPGGAGRGAEDPTLSAAAAAVAIEPHSGTTATAALGPHAPGAAVDPDDVERAVAAGGPDAPANPTAAADAAPVHVDLASVLRPIGPDAALVNPLVRPGDVISVAPAGSVLVEGWVEKPGAYPASRGLTVAGAIAAAGGPLFPADRPAVNVRRVLGPDEERSFTIDLEGVAAGRVADVPVVDGDVVRVPASPARVVPWAAWMAAKELINVGGNVLLF